MIDPNLFTVEGLIGAFFGTERSAHRDQWKLNAEIVPSWMPPFPTQSTQPKCVVKLGNLFLRHSAGPMQGHFWDMYGDDYLTPGLALRALFEAPIAPNMIKAEAWPRQKQEPFE